MKIAEQTGTVVSTCSASTRAASTCSASTPASFLDPYLGRLEEVASRLRELPPIMRLTA